MSSKKSKSEISVDPDNIEEALKKLEKCDGVNMETINLLKAAAKRGLKGEKADKNICPAAVKISTRERVNRAILEDKEVYELTINKKKFYFMRCSRPYYEGNKYCFKHAKTEDENPDNFFIFEKIKKNNNAKHLTNEDLLDIKKGGHEKAADDNPNPVVIITITQGLKNTIAKMFNIKKKLDNGESDTENGNSDENTDSENKSENNSENNSETEGEIGDETKDDNETKEENNDEKTEKNEEEEAEVTEINTKDGRILYYSAEDNNIYEPDEDEGKKIGKLMEVNDKDAPILYQDKYYIVADETIIEKNNVNYVRCVVSDKAYRDIDGEYIKVGKVKKQKNGKMEIELDKKSKK